MKPARNSGRDAPPGVIDKLFAVSKRSVGPIVSEKEDLLEPDTGKDLGAVPG